MNFIRINNRYLNLDQVQAVKDYPAEELVSDYGHMYSVKAELKVFFADTTETFEGGEADALREALDNLSQKPIIAKL